MPRGEPPRSLRGWPARRGSPRSGCRRMARADRSFQRGARRRSPGKSPRKPAEMTRPDEAVRSGHQDPAHHAFFRQRSSAVSGAQRTALTWARANDSVRGIVAAADHVVDPRRPARRAALGSTSLHGGLGAGGSADSCSRRGAERTSSFSAPASAAGIPCRGLHRVHSVYEQLGRPGSTRHDDRP